MVEHTSLTTGLTYDELVSGFEQELGRWDLAVAEHLLSTKAQWSEVEQEVNRLAGRRGLMIMSKIDQGALTSLSGKRKQCSLYLVGNPVIANDIIDIDIRGSFYVPFRVCLYGYSPGRDSIISYDRPSSFLDVLGHPQLSRIGVLLDQKIDGVAETLRRS